MSRAKLLITACGLFMAGMLFFATPQIVSAAESSGSSEEITLSPTRKQHQLQPGQTEQDSFKIINTGDVGYNFVVYARPYSVSGERYRPDYSSVLPRSDAYSWVQFEKTSWRIEPGETKEVVYQISVPDRVTPGGHYGVLFAETDPEEGSEGQAVVRKKRVGAILHIQVDGEIKKSGRPLEVNIPSFQFQPPLYAIARLENTGNVDVEAEVELIARDLFGNVKHRQTKNSVVYPSFSDEAQLTRAITIEWPRAAWFSIYKVDVSATFLDEELSQSSYVLILPRWLIVITVVALVGGGYVFIRRRQ